ncbi:hypothetical protein EXU48_06325 [Occultella glacieicola]|uniref:DUF6318 domain-containing protein n=1 Tax=Occultella glacieicola TaxID=2518684 RepID=A0ABY2E5L4_9MICO|nr:DUF6318 family protein [Occultella glacieicola]TDE95873.1 hypothetical protein EXU48_06325 [Occultella glacieicola]
MTWGSPSGRGRILGVPTAALALVLAVAACDGEAPVEPSTSATESPTEDPSTGEPTEFPSPERPAAMDEGGADNASEVAEYFLRLYSYGYATGDVSTWEEIADAECEGCAWVADDIDDLHSEMGFVDGGELTFEDSQVLPVEGSEETYRVEQVVTESELTYRYADGTSRSVDASTADVVQILQWREARWFVMAIDLVTR